MTSSSHGIRRWLREGAPSNGWPARIHALTDRLFASDACLCWRLGGLLIRLAPAWRPPRTAHRTDGGAQMTAWTQTMKTEGGGVVDGLAHLLADTHADRMAVLALRRVLLRLYVLLKTLPSEEELYIPILEDRLTPAQEAALARALDHLATERL